MNQSLRHTRYCKRGTRKKLLVTAIRCILRLGNNKLNTASPKELHTEICIFDYRIIIYFGRKKKNEIQLSIDENKLTPIVCSISSNTHIVPPTRKEFLGRPVDRDFNSTFC